MKRPRIFGVILGIYTFQCLSVLAYGLFKGAFDLTAGGLILALLSAGLWLAIEKKFKKGQVSWTSSHS